MPQPTQISQRRKDFLLVKLWQIRGQKEKLQEAQLKILKELGPGPHTTDFLPDKVFRIRSAHISDSTSYKKIFDEINEFFEFPRGYIARLKKKYHSTTSRNMSLSIEKAKPAR